MRMLCGVGIGVLGPIQVDGGDVPGEAALAPRERVVLAALAVRRGEVVSAEVLAEALWVGQLPPPSWPKVVQGCVVRLRKVLGPSAIETRDHGYRLVVPAEDVDAGRFERLVERARELLALGEPDRSMYTADEALALWRGRALTDLVEWSDGRIEAARLEELRLDAEELRLESALRAGRYREVLAEAQSRVAAAPLRERRWVLLALAQYQAGRQGDALRTLQHGRRTLVEELGVDPGAEIVALEAAILRHDPALLAAQAMAASGQCPYRGLVPYDVDDADDFFGRDAEISDCLGRLAASGVIAVVGPSGSGKSSLVRAGIAAVLRREGRRVIVVTPGPRPLDALTAMPTSGSPPVLVVDQLEQAITNCADADERGRFFAALTAHAELAPLVLALRADRLGELVAYPNFASLVESGLYLLKPMGEEQLRAAIESPVRQAGLLLEPGLVDLLVRDVEDEPGSLPLLSHALRQTWERREGNTLTVAGYRASGGIRGAVAQSAEQVYADASPEQRSTLRDVLLRLVTPSPDGEPVRSRVPRRLVATDADRQGLIDTLIDARLVTSDEDSVELAHEALTRAWPRFQEWLDDDVEGQRIWRHLTTAADVWAGMGRPDSELYRGVRLARAVDWLRRSGAQLTTIEAEFLDAGEQFAFAEQRAAADEARRQVRANRRLRALVGIVTVLALAAGAGVVATRRQARRADTAADQARAHELAASAIAARDENPSIAKLLAVASATATDEPSIAAMAALHHTWAADRVVARYGVTYEVAVPTAAVHPDGRLLAVAGAGPDNNAGWTLEVVDAFTDVPQWRVDVTDGGRHPSAFVARPRFTPDGSQVVAGVFWEPHSPRRLPVPFAGVDEPVADVLGAHVWDTATGALLERIDLGRCGGVVVGMSDTHVLAKTLHGEPDVVEGCRWRDAGTGVELVDRRTGQRRVLTERTNQWVLWGAALSDDGRFAAFDDFVDPDGDEAGIQEVVVVDTATGDEVLRVEGQTVRDLNADGSLLLVGSGPFEVWDVATGDVVTTFDGHDGFSFEASFAPDGTTVYSNGGDGALRAWDARSGMELLVMPNVGAGPISVNADGIVAAGNPTEQNGSLIDTRVRGELGAFTTCAGATNSNSLDVVGEVVALQVACGEGEGPATTFLLDAANGRRLHTVPDREWRTLAIAPDGTRFVDRQDSAGGDGALVVRDLESARSLVELEPLEGEQRIWRVRWSPDSTKVAAALGFSVAVWDADTGDLVHTAEAPGSSNGFADILFSPDSQSLVMTAPWHITRRSLDTWEVVAERGLFVDGAQHAGLVGYSADGDELLLVGPFQWDPGGALTWLDPETFGTRRAVTNIHEGSILAAALSPSAGRVATASSDGSVRVWSVATGELVHEVPFDGPVEGVDFVDERRLAIALAGGDVVVVTTDPEELLTIVRASLTRGFSTAACARYGFSVADCPTLVDLGAPLPEGAEVESVEGEYRVEWTKDELLEAVITSTRAFLEVSPTEPWLSEMEALVTDMAGTYTLRFADGRYEFTTDAAEQEISTGTYFVRGGRLWLRSERGLMSWPVKFFDAAFEVDDEGLRLDGDTFRGELPNLLAYATRPLERIS